MTDVAWVTGASAGIGAAVAQALVERGWSVIGVSRSPGEDRRWSHLEADLSTPEGWEVMTNSFAAVMDVGADRALLVHAAGTAGPFGPAHGVDGEEYRQAVLLNGAAPLVVGQQYVACAVDHGVPATVVMLSSGPSIYPGWSSYKPGKAAVDSWCATVGAEHEGPSPAVRAYAVTPGPVDTGMQRQVREADPDAFPKVGKFKALHESGELPSPEWAAEGILAVVDGDFDNGAFVNLVTDL